MSFMAKVAGYPSKTPSGPFVGVAASAHGIEQPSGRTGVLTDGGRAGIARWSVPVRGTQAVRVAVTEQMDAAQVLHQTDDLPALLIRAGIDLPPASLNNHLTSMSALLNAGSGLSGAALSERVQRAADDLHRLYQDFLAVLPSGDAEAGSACQAVASLLVAQARLINHIHHTGEVPPEPDRFLDLTAQHPPSRLDSMPLQTLPPSGTAA